jgi:ABC-type multidrug transport system permease subunit
MSQPHQKNSQSNQANGNANIYSVQGNQASQYVNSKVHNKTINKINGSLSRSWTGFAAVLIMATIDFAFSAYAKSMYTGIPGDSGDLWRAGIFLLLIACTGSTLRRWLRRW